MKKKTALVIGAGGFIGSHMVKRLKDEGYFVRGVDLKYPQFSPTAADEFYQESINKNPLQRFSISGGFDEVYQFAADMGGAGYIFSKDHDSEIYINSHSVNMTCSQAASLTGVKKFFFSSSACVYPEHLQQFPDSHFGFSLKESDAYPANPDSVYGWEKLASEQLYLAHARNYNLDIRIARFHNIYGPEGTFYGGKEKAPAALCRKVAFARDGEPIEVWGSGEQTRSFLYIDECIEGVRRMMYLDYSYFGYTNMPVLNIGSDEMVTINALVKMIIDYSGKKLYIKNVDSTLLGVQGRNSNNDLIKEVLGWSPNYHLAEGIQKTYDWILTQITEPISKLFNQN